MTAVYRPYVELLVDDVHVATVRFELRVQFVVKALVATVRHAASTPSGSGPVT
jgi:hypothetical protein